MTKKNVLFRLMYVFMSILLSVSNINAQSDAVLNIGDPAPALKYSKWIKGKPVSSLNGDQLYVLEFWVTWCGPCKAAMPHLTKLQEDYKGKVTFIGVGVWEKVPEGKPYESSLASVVKFVEGNDANMGYSVIADNNDQFMGNKWLKAAGENGIPSTFIVKNNQIIWIGHPNSLDSTLPKILGGSYDMEAFKSAFSKTAAAGRKQAADMAALFQPIQDAIKAKEYDKAFGLMEKMKTEKPYMKGSMDMMKFGVLLNNVSEEKAIEFATTIQHANKSIPSLILGEVYNKNSFSSKTYLWVAKNFEESKPSNANPIVLHALASCYAKGGDFTNAVINEEKAVEGAKKALKDGSMIGSIMDYTVVEYEATLANYKKGRQ